MKMYFNSNFTNVCDYVSNWHYLNISAGNGLMLNRQQAITWGNDDQSVGAYMHYQASMS